MNLSRFRVNTIVGGCAARPQRRSIWSVAAIAIAAGACGGGEPTARNNDDVRTLRVSVSSTGVDVDPDGYLVSIDDAGSERLAVNGFLTRTVPAGARRVRLSGLSSNCTAIDGPERTITTGEQEVIVAFVVTCRIRQLAFSSNRSGTYQVYLMDRDGANVRQLTNVAPPAIAIVGSWSSDGSKLLFSSNEGGDHDIFVMSADGSDRRPLTTSPGLDGSADWSPDGTRIAFRSERDGNSEIYVMRADGSGQSRLTSTPGIEDGPRWSPDGSRIVFQYRVPGTPSEVRVMNADGSGMRSLTDPAVDHYHPDWSPDGSRIVCVSQPDHIREIIPSDLFRTLFVMNADGSGRKQLTNPGDYAILPQWAPDGRMIAYTAVVGGRYQLRTTDGDFTTVNRLSVSGQSDDYLAVWRP